MFFIFCRFFLIFSLVFLLWSSNEIWDWFGFLVFFILFIRFLKKCFNLNIFLFVYLSFKMLDVFIFNVEEFLVELLDL